MKQLLTLVIAMSTITVLAFAAVPMTTANASDRECPPDIVGQEVDGNVEVNGFCQIFEGRVNGNVMLDSAGDDLRFNSATLNGNIEAKDSDGVFVIGVPRIAQVATIMGNVISENTDLTLIGGVTTIGGNVEVEDGDLTVGSTVEILGNVIHRGSGTCFISPGATVHGNIEGCP